MTVLQFRKYRAGNPRNGECYAVETSIDYGVVHMSRSGDSAGWDGGYKTMAEAEIAAWHQARRRNCIFLSSMVQA